MLEWMRNLFAGGCACAFACVCVCVRVCVVKKSVRYMLLLLQEVVFILLHLNFD